MKGKDSSVFPGCRIPAQVPLTFLSALFSGMLAHGMGLWNKLSWHDDIQALFWEGSTISSGRWMLHVLGWLEKLFFESGHFSLPAFNGLFALCMLAAAAAALVHLLIIRRKVCCMGLGCLMAVFPTVTALLGYMFTIHYYMLAMVMIVVSTCLICGKRRWWGKAFAVLLGGCSLGIYQAFFPLMPGILLIWNMDRLADRKEKNSDFLKQTVTQVLCMVGVIGFYFVMNRFFLHKFGVETNTYMGIDQMGSTPLADYLLRIKSAYLEFFLPSRYVSADMYPLRAWHLYHIMLGVDLMLGILRGVCIWKDSRAKALLFLLMAALFPLANNLIYVMAEPDHVHGLMTFGLTAQFVLFVYLVDRIDFQGIFHSAAAARFLCRGLSICTAVVLGLMGIIYVRFDNQCYLKATFQQQEAISFFTALSAQIKASPGFRDDTPVVFLNEQEISDRTLYHMEELDFIHLDPYGENIYGYVNSYAWRAFMERWCGFCPVWADPSAYVDLPEVKAMPHYPDDGSIQMLGDTIVVNF